MWAKSFISFVFINILFIFTKCDAHSKIFYISKNKKIYDDSVSNIRTDLRGYPWVSTAKYENLINSTGFAYLELATNGNYFDEEQAFLGGYLEGCITRDLIYSQWYNTVHDFITTNNKTVVTKVKEFLNYNSKWMNETITKYQGNDTYWYQMKLIYTQIEGMYEGYNICMEDKKLEWNDFLWLSVFYDLVDLYNAFGGNQASGDNDHCSVLIKILPGNKDIYFGHNSWTTYQSMLRIQKKYTFNFNLSPDSTEVLPGKSYSLSSYPGSITSMDDFYLSSSGIAATETTNEIFNKTLWNNIKPNNIVWGNFRGLLAIRLANSSENWVKIFEAYNSGTYNNQWMILDYKKFKTGQNPKAGAFWVAEQIPSKIVAKDLTNVLIEKGYWSSYNIPYFEEIYNISGNYEQFKKYGNWFSHELAPRAQIFKRDHVKVKDMNSFMDLMRSNDYKNEPFAHCSCNPPYSASGAIASRKDLNPVNGTFQFKAQGHEAAGAIDAKITNSSIFLKFEFISVYGPTTGTNNKLPVFKWSTSNFTKTPRMSHPDEWNFKPVLHEWEQF